MNPIAPRWKFELVLGIALLCAGVFLVPLTVYWVGAALAGEYGDEQGLWGLLRNIWGDAGRGRLTAWGLVLAPYLMVQLARLAVRLLRREAA